MSLSSEPRFSRHYSLPTEVPEYECDVSRRAKLSFLLKLVQRASNANLLALGISYDDLRQEGQVFLLAKLGLRIRRCPMAGESIVLRTLPQGIQGAQFFREVFLTTPDGEVLVEAHTVWLLVDPDSRRILRPNQFRHELPQLPPEQWLEPLGNQRYKTAGEPLEEWQTSVRYSDLDVNEHLNNTVYADLVTNSLPYEPLISHGVGAFHIHYQKEARLGAALTLTSYQEGNIFYVVGKMGEERCFESRLELFPPAGR